METSADDGEGDKINYTFTVTNTGNITLKTLMSPIRRAGSQRQPIDAPLTGSVVAPIRSDMPMFGDPDPRCGSSRAGC